MSYVYSVATENDREEIEQLLIKYYLIDETLNAVGFDFKIFKYWLNDRIAEYEINRSSQMQAANIRDIDYIPIMKPTVEICLKAPLSFVARHSETGELAGVILNSIWKRGEDDPYYLTTTRNDAIAAAHDQVVNDIHSSFWKLVDSQVNSALHQEMSSVAVAHRRNGIASRLVKLSMEVSLLEDHGVGGVVVEASSVANQILHDKFGFTTLNSIDYADYKDENGNPLLIPKDGTTKIELKWKSIGDIKR